MVVSCLVPIPSTLIKIPRQRYKTLNGGNTKGPNICSGFHPAHQTSVANLRIPATSPDPVTARVIQDSIATSAKTIPLSTVEPSASTPPPTSTFPPGAVAVQNIADRCTSLDIAGVPTLPSPTPFLYNILPTGSHLSLLAPAVLHKKGDALGPPSAIQENIMPAPDQILQSPSVTDVVVADKDAHASNVVSAMTGLYPWKSGVHDVEECETIATVKLRQGIEAKIREAARDA
ncbi:hypothetical protein EDB84DRAFT_1676108 [Lactarius hengduanensis]|nr:hypothetical protein EDB84DRAFT_1676108 [Lactarius hengduanensis]